MAITDNLVLVDGHVEKHGPGLYQGDERGQVSWGVMRVDERLDEGRIIDRPIGIPPGFQGDLIHRSGILDRLAQPCAMSIISMPHFSRVPPPSGRRLEAMVGRHREGSYML
jgi:hypothetical protein